MVVEAKGGESHASSSTSSDGFAPGFLNGKLSIVLLGFSECLEIDSGC